VKRTAIVVSCVAAACARSTPPSAPVVVADLPLAAPPAKESRAGALPSWRADEAFRFRVEQKGSEIAIADHHATIARGPFDLVLVMRRDRDPADGMPPFSIAVHATRSDEIIASASHGGPLPDSAFGMGSGMAEQSFDADHGLFESRSGHHEIYWSAKDDHRCASAELLTVDATDDTLVCRRTVERLIRPGSKGVELRVDAPRRLHLVLVKLGRRADRVEERQRDWVTLDIP
jgi:hypothetical protein